MRQPSASGVTAPPFHAVTGGPLAGVNMTLPGDDRRETARRSSVVRRIAAEFREMPGLVLTVQQASRFLDVDPATCERILARLARHGVLRRGTGGGYVSA